MKKIRRGYLNWLICFVIICIIVSFFLPFTSSIEKEINIHSGKNLIIKKIADLKTYVLWYPWLNSVSDVSADYSGISGGLGSWMKWDNKENNIKGSYYYKITKVSSDSLLGFNFCFPNHTKLTGNFILNNSLRANLTHVIWNVKIKSAIGGWLWSLFSKRNKVLGDAMEAGLINLKILAEEAPKYHGLEIEEVPLKQTFIATISDTVTKDEIFENMPVILKRIRDEMVRRQFKVTGSPMIQMQNIGKKDVLLNVGVPVDHNGNPTGNIQILRIPPGYALCAEYNGEYKNVTLAYNALSQYARDHAKASPAPPWEEYKNDVLPKNDTDSCSVTVYYPVYR